jgi:hypothetical protein
MPNLFVLRLMTCRTKPMTCAGFVCVPQANAFPLDPVETSDVEFFPEALPIHRFRERPTI